MSEPCFCYAFGRRSRKRCHCKDCGRPLRECGKLSQYGRCVECACIRERRATYSMVAQEGPAYDRWIRAMRAYVETG